MSTTTLIFTSPPSKPQKVVVWTIVYHDGMKPRGQHKPIFISPPSSRPAMVVGATVSTGVGRYTVTTPQPPFSPLRPAAGKPHWCGLWCPPQQWADTPWQQHKPLLPTPPSPLRQTSHGGIDNNAYHNRGSWAANHLNSFSQSEHCRQNFAWKTGVATIVGWTVSKTFKTCERHIFTGDEICQLHCPHGIFSMGNSGCLPWGKPAATGSRYPTYGACSVFLMFP